MVNRSEAVPRRAGAGRPRDPAVDAAILAAAVELIGEVGLATASIRAVADRAGVPRSTVYRRHATMYDLLAAVVGAIEEAQPVADTGDLREDLLQTLHPSVHGLSAPHQRRLTTEMIAAAASDDAVREVMTASWERRRHATRQIIHGAVQRGELPGDTDADVLLDLLTGLVHVRLLVRDTSVSPDVLRQAIDIVVAGAGSITLQSDSI